MEPHPDAPKPKGKPRGRKGGRPRSLPDGTSTRSVNLTADDWKLLEGVNGDGLSAGLRDVIAFYRQYNC